MLTYQKLLELKHKRAELVAQGKELLLKKDLEGHKALMVDIDSLNGEIEAVEKQLELVERVRKELPHKTIWCYSGYLFEELAAGKIGAHSRALLEGLDVLVDDPFVLAKKDLGLRFRGSSNQRIIDVPASLETGEVRLAEEYMQ